MANVKVFGYGGSGQLDLRAFVALLVLGKFDASYNVDISIMDFDDVANDDRNDLEQFISEYRDLYDLVHCTPEKTSLLPGIADCEVNQDNATTLAAIRANAYNKNVANAYTYSLKDVFSDYATDMLRSCFTSDQITDSNEKGCYGDLSRNALIASQMVGHFTYSNQAKYDYFVYCGSTDGGTANTNMDYDIESLCGPDGTKVNNKQGAKVFAVRTLPYKTFNPVNSDANAQRIAEKIKADIVPQSVGVISNIFSKRGYVRDNMTANTPTAYLLDGLFLAGCNISDKSQLSDTNYDRGEAKIASQHHGIHITELTAAMMMCDSVLGNIEADPAGNNFKAIYGYNVSSAGDVMDAQAYFGPEFSDKIKNFLRLYSALKYCVMLDFDDASRDPKNSAKYIKNLFNVGFLHGKSVDSEVCADIRDTIQVFLDKSYRVVQILNEIQNNSVFYEQNGNSCRVEFYPNSLTGIRLLLDEDNNTPKYYSSADICTADQGYDDSLSIQNSFIGAASGEIKDLYADFVDQINNATGVHRQELIKQLAVCIIELTSRYC